MKVLIVDDQLYFRNPMVRLLEQRGFHVVACRSSDHAVEQASTGEPVAAAFIDVNLPGVSGVDTAALIKREAPGATVYLTTPTDRALLPENWTGLGVAGVIQKPIPADDLAELCAAAIAACSLDQASPVKLRQSVASPCGGQVTRPYTAATTGS